MSLTKDGFYKSFSGAIGNNNYLLEAGGDHIAWGNAANQIPYSNGTLNTNLNADMTDGLHVHSGRNNEANKIVRTDGSGYIQAGWINTTSGDMGTTAIDRIYCSNDGYIRYKTKANFINGLDAYWANIKVSSSSSTSTSPTFNTAYTSNWFRSTGATGWYSESYSGGIYMTDSTYVRVYNSKAFYVSNSTYYAINTAGGFYGKLYSLNTERYILKPWGADYRTTTGTHTGAICITLPASIGNTMVSMWIDIYNYVSHTSFSVHIGGYTYNNSTWANSPSAMVYGANHTVRLGHNGTSFVIYIGETNSTWSYPQVSVRDIVLGYSPSYSNWANQWSISFVTSFSNVTATITNYTWTSRNQTGLFTSFGNSGNNITATIGGTTKTFTVNYASNAGNADTVDGQHFTYSNSSNSPTYLWGTNSSGSNFLAARGSITVGYSTYANNVYVTQNISSNADYPLIWTNQNNTSSAWGQQLYKSYDYLLYNPSTKVLRNDGPLWLRPDRDATLKIYSGKVTDGYSDGFICMQTSIDGTDGQSHSHPTNYGARCVIALQPRGGEVYIGKTITAASTSADTTYKLNVGGHGNFDGNIWGRGSGVYLRLGPQNGTYAHYETNASTSHWFNKRIDVNGDIYLYGTSVRMQKSNGYIYSSGFYHNSYGSATYLLRSDGGAAAFNWSGQSGQPTWVWGGNSQHTYYVYNPSNFSVNYANSAGSATNASWLTPQSHFHTGRALGYAQTNNGPLDGSNSTGTPTSWAHYILMSHDNGQTYYHYQLAFPFWGPPMYQRKEGGSSTSENQKPWYTFLTTENWTSIVDGRYLPLSGGWMNWTAQINFKGSGESTSVYSRIGYATGTINGVKMHTTQTNAFYICTNGDTSATDNAGLAIDNDGVTVFGAGDVGSVFRVLNEDNVSDGAQFLVTKSSGVTTKYSHTAQRFISNVATGTQPYACSSTTCNTNLNADLLDGYHESSFFRYRGDISANYVDLTTYTANATNYQNPNNGIWRVQRSGYSASIITFTGSGSASGLDIYFHYAKGDDFKFRRRIDSNRLSGAWETFITSENISSQSVYFANYAEHANFADALSGGIVVSDLNSTSLNRNRIYYHVDVASNRPNTSGKDGYGAYGNIFQISNQSYVQNGISNHWINQLDFIHNGPIYYRQRINSNAWTSWEKIITSRELPVGIVMMWLNSTPPTNWLICNGSTFSSTDYPDLYAVLGSTTLPNFNGRVPVGAGYVYSNGAFHPSLKGTGGEVNHTLTINEMPYHTHGYEFLTSWDDDGNPGSRIPTANANEDGGWAYQDINGNKSGQTSSLTIKHNGYGNSHNNIQPWYGVYFIIKAK